DVDAAGAEVVEERGGVLVDLRVHPVDRLDRLLPDVPGDRADLLALQVVDGPVRLVADHGHRGWRVVHRIGEEALLGPFGAPADPADGEVDAVRLHTAEHALEVGHVVFDLQAEVGGRLLEDLGVEADQLAVLDVRVRHVRLDGDLDHALFDRVEIGRRAAHRGRLRGVPAAAGHQKGTG